MRRGALAIFDALGFKGVWAREETREHPEVVIEKLRGLQEHAAQAVERLRTDFPVVEKEIGVRLEVQTVFLSDTVVIGAWADLTDGASTLPVTRDWAAIYTASKVTSEVVAQGARRPAPLAYRGCLTFGEFALAERFIVGPAVDAAAEAMDEANGALVWLAPSAKKCVHAAIEADVISVPPLLRTHGVPMKGGASYRTWVVSPFDSVETADDRESYIRAVLDTFASDRVDIQIKAQNTAAFLIYEHKRLQREERAARERASTAPAKPNEGKE